MEHSLWNETNPRGYQFANWDRLAKEEPTTIALLKKEKDARAQDDLFFYYVRFHDRYGFSIARRRKDFRGQEQGRPLEQEQQQCPRVNTTEMTVAEILRIVQRLERKIEGRLPS